MKHFVALLLGVITSAAQAEGLLPCQLTTDKWLIYNPYTACVSAYAEAFGRGMADKDGNQAEPGVLAQAYGSVGLGHWTSLHLRGGFSGVNDAEDKEFKEYHRLEQFFLQLGHPIVDPFYASVGRIDAPFGLNHDDFRLSLPSRAQRLWLSSVNGGRIGLGTRDGFRLEVGTSNLDQEDPVTGEERTMISGRIVTAIDLLDGARIMASYASSSDYGQRRMGLATLVHNNDSRTSLEWIRLTEQIVPNDFQQIFRFVHEQQQKTWSWVLAIEEMRREGYRISYGVSRPWEYNLIGTLSAHYQKEPWEPRDHFILMMGIGIGRAWVWEEQDP